MNVHYNRFTVGAVAGQPPNAQGIVDSLPAWSYALCDPKIVVSGLDVMYMGNCMFVDVPTTLEKVVVWGND